MPYTKTTDFAIKDTYLSGNPAKVVKGAEIDTEFENIETNFNSIGPLGTAAAATLTTTATDTTAGRVLKVGDFGLGGNLPVWPQSTMNGASAIGTGFYLVPNTVAAIPYIGYWIVEHVLSDGGDFYHQTMFDVNVNNAFMRMVSAGIASPWVEVWTTSNLVKTTSATDTTAGRMLKVGDFGLPTVANYLALPSPGVTDGVTDLNTITGAGWWNKLLGGAPGSRPANFPTGQTGQINYVYLFVLDFSASQTQIAYSYSSIAGQVAQQWMRHGVGGAWSAWVEVATSANSLGQGQTWQNVTGSRALGTTYTNSTGRDIEVVVEVGSGSGTSAANVNVGGTVVAALYAVASIDTQSISFSVQNGGTYSVTQAYGTPTNVGWRERR